ncbi:hypothetical protein Mapa_000530 [Marchantia paleacea]|nr:hypothetical protein Mapa_000530 [Marchantia paleacea]
MHTDGFKLIVFFKSSYFVLGFIQFKLNIEISEHQFWSCGIRTTELCFDILSNSRASAELHSYPHIILTHLSKNLAATSTERCAQLCLDS